KATEVYGTAIDRAAVSEAKYRLAPAQAHIRLSEVTGKRTAAVADAPARVEARHEYEVWMVYDAAAESAKQYLYTLRARLDALRTLNANVRMLTDPRLPT